jgi:hypothetical protein
VTEERRYDLLACGTLAAIITIYFFDVVIGQGVFYTRDVALYHFPLNATLRAVVEGGEFPYWNPLLSGGQPLAANPAYQLFYPPTWLIFLPSFIYGFNAHVLIHVYLAAFGVYALLRSLGASRAAAWIGAVSFTFGGFVLTGLSLFPFLFSAAWLPWTCLFTRRFLRDRSPRDFALAAGSLGMQFLVGEPVMVAQTGMLLGLYALARRTRLRDLGAVAAISIAALLLAAVQILPGLDHARDSVRAGGFTFESVTDWSTPPPRLIEAVYPGAFGSLHASGAKLNVRHSLYPGRAWPFILSIYSGLLILLTAFAGIAGRVRGRWLYLTALAVSLLLALGKYTPLWWLLYDAGVVRSIRYPEKFLIMGIFATVIFGALAADRLLSGDARVRNAAIVLAVIAGTAAAFRQSPLDVVRALVLVTLFLATLRVRRPIVAALLGVFVLADLTALIDLAPRVPAVFYTSPPPVLRHLAPNRAGYRIYHVGNWAQKARNRREYKVQTPSRFLIERNSLTGFAANTYGVRNALEVDFDLTSLQTTDDLAKAAWDLQPRFPRWLDYITAMSNVRYVALFRPARQAAAEAHGDARLMEPIRFIEGLPHPRYYFASSIATARNRAEFVSEVAGGRHDPRTAFVADAPFAPAPGKVLRAADSANRARIEVETAGVAFLVMSVTAHKYWQVTIDGVEVPAVITNLAYQGVVVPRGRHVVEMRYRNPLIAAGAAVSAATLLALLFAGWRRGAASTMRDL